MSESKEKRSPRDLLRTVFRRKQLFLLTAGLIAILVGILCHYWPKKYTSAATFQRVDNEAVSLGRQAEEGAAFDDVMRSKVMHDLKRKDAIERALNEIGLLRDLPRDATGELTPEGRRMKQDLITETREKMTITWPIKTGPVDEIILSFTHHDPEVAAEFPNVLVRNYISEISSWITRELTRQLARRQSEESEALSRLNAASHAVQEFRIEHEYVSEDLPAIERRITELENRREVQQGELDLANFRLAAYEAKKKEIETGQIENEDGEAEEVKVMGPNQRKLDKQEELRKARESLNMMQTINRMKDAHPQVIKQKLYIKDLETQIAEMPDEIVLERHLVQRDAQGLTHAFQLELESLKFQIRLIARDVKQLDADLASLNRARAEYNTYREDYEKLARAQLEAEKNYDDVREQRLHFQNMINQEEGRRRTRLETIELAEVQHKPSSPKFLVVLGASLALGIAAGAGLIFLSHLLDRTIATPEEASQYFALPIHGVIGEIVTPAQKRYRKLRRRLVIPVLSVIVLTGLALAIMSNYLRLEHPNRYQQWSADPIHFITSQALEPVLDKISNLIP
jgi:uncharacterized protein involved in exopolysaccharide biosynthesis